VKKRVENTGGMQTSNYHPVAWKEKKQKKNTEKIQRDGEGGEKIKITRSGQRQGESLI